MISSWQSDLPGLPILEQSWISYFKKCLMHSKQYDLLKVQLLFDCILVHVCSCHGLSGSLCYCVCSEGFEVVHVLG